MWPKIITCYSPNFNIPKRPKKKIKHIIIHYTGMKKESLAIDKLCQPNSNVSAHYFIKKNGDVLSLVPDLYEAWHAGKSSWKKYKSLNKSSIGIEIQNPGHQNNYKNFKKKQINSLIKLLKKLVSIHKINKKDILGHSDIAPNRKKDPGEKFPWKKLHKLGLSHWHNLNENKIRKYRLKKLNKFEQIFLLKNIGKIGYDIKSNLKRKNVKIFLRAFQRRFRQSLINGIPDKECLIISKNLLKP